jgi:hypothetical protein
MAPGCGSDPIYNKGLRRKLIRQFLDHIKRDGTRQRALTVGGTAARLLEINQLTKALD